MLTPQPVQHRLQHGPADSIGGIKREREVNRMPPARTDHKE